MNLVYSELNDWLIENKMNLETMNTVLDYRLPTDLLPYNYDILVKFQFVNTTAENDSFPYDGEVTIYFTCVKNTSNIVLHINNLIINNSTLLIKSLTDQSFGALNSFNWYNDYKRQFFVANLTASFRVGHNYTFYTKFTGFLKDDLSGFYRSSYINENNLKVWLATSEMEPTDARKSFPCFDEPAMKATFKISVIHQSDYKAMSNMPVDKVKNM